MAYTAKVDVEYVSSDLKPHWPMLEIVLFSHHTILYTCLEHCPVLEVYGQFPVVGVPRVPSLTMY